LKCLLPVRIPREAADRREGSGAPGPALVPCLARMYTLRLWMNRLIGVDTVKLTGPEIAAIMTQLKLGFESGYLRPGEFLERPFEEAIQAYKDLDEGRSRKKQVLVMKQSPFMG
jgi:hypothetical protein